MSDNTDAKPTLVENVTKAIEELKSTKDYLPVAGFLCEIDIETQSHGIAVQDAINSMMHYSNDSTDGCIVDLEAILEARRRKGAAYG